MIVEHLDPGLVREVVEVVPAAARQAEAYLGTGQEFALLRRHCPLEGGEFCRERCPLKCEQRDRLESDEQ